jgi:hypothetical protein
MRKWLFVLVCVLAFALPGLAQAGDQPKAAVIALTVAAAAAVVIVIVQFVKEKIIPGLWDKFGDLAKFVVSVLASVGVTLYKYLILEHLPINFGTLTFCIEVVIAATIGYSVAKGIAPTLSRSATKPN